MKNIEEKHRLENWYCVVISNKQKERKKERKKEELSI